MSKRIQIYTQEDVADHNNESTCWISRHNKVYDVSRFIADHPGGDELILQFAGKAVDNVMADKAEHEHSEAAYEMLEDFLIGRIGRGESLVSEDWDESSFHPEDTDSRKDFERNQFLDLEKPLLEQLWYANFSKSYYLQQVHQPRHLAYTARMFGPAYLEIFAKTLWYIVPVFWLPIIAYIFTRSLLQFSGPIPSVWANPFITLSALRNVTPEAVVSAVCYFLLGNFLWTIIEYGMHRFVFHIDALLPDRPIFLLLHFTFHGVHHYLPTDRLRLVMPPALFGILQYPFTQLAYAVCPLPVANAIISGIFFFYVLYDVTHYALHHTKLPRYFQDLKRYHLAHHYKNFDLGFGVTSKFWDYIFNTVLPV